MTPNKGISKPIWMTVRSGRLAFFAALVLAAAVAVAVMAPLLMPHDPFHIQPANRLKPPGDGFLLGTDSLGRDLLSRIILGSRISLSIGVMAAVLAVVFGLLLGLLAGSVRWLDPVIMRVVDGVMAIPGILLAIAIVSLLGAGLATLLVAITLPEIPRVVRLVRSSVLSAREEPYVEAAVALGTPPATVMVRHLLPNAVAPLIVQGTYVCAAAILTEAILSFLGVGLSPEIPSWGSIMAEGRLMFRLNPGIVLWPGLAISLVILSINILGDAARDTFDPKMARREVDR